MRYSLMIGIAAAAAVTVSPVWAQAPPPGTYQPQRPPPASYPLNALAPEDAYRQGLITRWEFEQLAGPTPQALQGPNPNGDRGGGRGGP